MGKTELKNSLTSSLCWSAFGVYVATLYRIAVFKYTPISIVYEQFKLVALGSIKIRLASANFVPLRSIAWYVFEDQKAALVNIVGNIITFMPLGLFLPFISSKTNRLKIIAPIGFASSLSIEVIQLIFGFGCFDVDDIILNTLGTCLGFFAYRVIEKTPEHSEFGGSRINLHDTIMGVLLCFVTLFNYLLLTGCRFF